MPAHADIFGEGKGNLAVKIIKPYAEIITPINGDEVLKHIELCGRVCYKSEARITPDSAKRFVASIIRNGHESVLEHYSFTVRFVCDRGVSHEIVRHRIASYSQESTRYCNYGNGDGGITVIAPRFWPEGSEAYGAWLSAVQLAERRYLELLHSGATPEEARAVLPNSLKTEVIMTANLREWRHFFRLRAAKASHPQMREVVVPLLDEVRRLIPVVFDDITGEGPATGESHE